MSLIALTTNLHVGLLYGRDIGVVTTPLTREQFIKEVNVKELRGFYPKPGFHLDIEMGYVTDFLHEWGVDAKIIRDLRLVKEGFLWTEIYSVLYYMEPVPNGVSMEHACYLKLERKPNDFIEQP